MSCHSLLPTIEFPIEEIERAVAEKKLLSLELELSLRCNFSCPYCYQPEQSYFNDELSKDEIFQIITQAADLGVRKIILLGGEPMLYPYIWDIISFLRDLNIDIELFTNGYGLSMQVARQLFENNVNVVMKMNTFDEQLQDQLTGVKGSYVTMQQALNNLLASGYPSSSPFLAVSTIICRQNYSELKDLWIWLRKQDILPYFEIITPQGRANENDWLSPEVSELEVLFNDIAEIDKRDFGYTWDIQPPLIGSKCLRHRFSCLVSSKGDIYPCVGIPVSVGNIRERSLKKILHESEVIQNLRDYKTTIKGPCGECENSAECYGCRGAAYNLTGDYLGSDPLCWYNSDSKHSIDYLPMPVKDLIPQKSPMRVIDDLLSIGERTGEVNSRITSGMICVSESGRVDSSIYIEMIAQAAAAVNCFLERGSTVKSEGFLLGVRKLKITGSANVGDTLRISIFKEVMFGDFGIINGEVYKGDAIIASGEIKVYHKTNEEK